MSPAERQALAELDSRIAAMERRLNNAKASRDSFVDFLRSKYPQWSSSLAGRALHTSNDTIVNRLATSDYNWDEEWDRRTRVLQLPRQAKLYQDIPRGGPLLMSDVARVKRRLTEIARHLSIMRETRLNLTTEDYFRTRVEFEGRAKAASSFMDTLLGSIFSAGNEDDTMLAIRNRLSDISLTTFEPLGTPTAEKMAAMRHEEEREAYIADLRAGRVLPTTMEPLKITPQPISITPQQPAAVEPIPAPVTVNEESKEVIKKPAESEPQHPTTSEPQPREVAGLPQDKKRGATMSDPAVDEHLEEELEHGDEDEQHEEGVQAEPHREEEDQTNKSPEMDDDDVAEMSMIAAQIESAEDFNLTFETVDTSDLHEEEKPKGRRRSLKNVSPLYESDRHEIAEFLEEGINESTESVTDKANTSVAEALLGEWGSPRVDPKRSAHRQRHSSEKRKSAESKATLLATPKSRQPLKELTHTPSNTRKRLSSSSIESDGLSPGRKRRSSLPKSGEKVAAARKRTSSISTKSQVQSPKQVLRARNV
ncbi:hypothetical protein Y032_0010g1010 [Ancylostoma ceylanicum]|uniref:Uncharacterized protein n=2 Tax=Ancylostoma ceylanicum TaxID=53326 RepID=A0A016VFK5_9BILA|nr:hypothetical protein Y032_0010g1010 [Ancylostoma ceylanicum]